MGLRSYDEALAEVTRALAFGINPSLEGIEVLCSALGRPQDSFAVVQVTGTNGKTSTARLTEALLRSHGRATALYTSPELERYPERFEIGGRVASDNDVARALSAVLDAADVLRPGAQGTDSGFTEFELTTAAALWLFRDAGVDVAVLEVGMGGRWDATSVAAPAVAVITGVGLDHTAVLGDTLEAIAAEKAAIIRPASMPVLGPGTAGLEPVFLEAAERAHTHARLVREGSIDVGEYELVVRYDVVVRPDAPAGRTVLDVRGVHGSYPALGIAAPAYQAANVATAVAAAEAALGRALDVDRTRDALLGVAFPGRFELVQEHPQVLVDGSHNPQAAEVLAGAVQDAWDVCDRRPIVLLGVLADKDARGIVEALAPVAGGFAVAAPASPRALAVRDLAAIVSDVTGVEPACFATLRDALSVLLANPLVAENGLLVTGSLTTAGEARMLLRDGSAT